MVAACSALIMLLGVFSVGAAGQGESGAASKGPVTLQYAFWGDQNEINATQAYLNGYMEKNPNVKIEALNFGSNTDFNTKITTLAASNSLPDIGYFYETAAITPCHTVSARTAARSHSSWAARRPTTVWRSGSCGRGPVPSIPFPART